MNTDLHYLGLFSGRLQSDGFIVSLSVIYASCLLFSEVRENKTKRNAWMTHDFMGTDTPLTYTLLPLKTKLREMHDT